MRCEDRDVDTFLWLLAQLAIDLLVGFGLLVAVVGTVMALVCLAIAAFK